MKDRGILLLTLMVMIVLSPLGLDIFLPAISKASKPWVKPFQGRLVIKLSDMSASLTNRELRLSIQSNQLQLCVDHLPWRGCS